VKTKDDARLKSWLLLFAGLIGMGYQQYTGKVSWPLLLTFTVMTGIAGSAEVISLIKSSRIVLPSSSSQQEHSDLDSDSVLRKSLEDEK
jgi:hypothetical protein